jgi:gluconokinase
MIVVVMGVSGCGKSTVAGLLAHELRCTFLDGDDFHSATNRAKMQAGTPLTDADREPWLEDIRASIEEANKDGRSLVIACSALKAAYRDVLRGEMRDVQFVYLKADFGLLQERLQMRKDHFFNPALLQSQLDTLEEPSDAVTVNVSLPCTAIVAKVMEQFHARGSISKPNRPA